MIIKTTWQMDAVFELNNMRYDKEFETGFCPPFRGFLFFVKR